MIRPQTEVHRVIDGRHERCCRCCKAWLAQTSRHFYVTMRDNKPRWSVDCKPCEKARTSERWARLKEGRPDPAPMRQSKRRAMPNEAPPQLTWANLLP